MSALLILRKLKVELLFACPSVVNGSCLDDCKSGDGNLVSGQEDGEWQGSLHLSKRPVQESPAFSKFLISAFISLPEDALLSTYNQEAEYQPDCPSPTCMLLLPQSFTGSRL